MDLYVAGGYYRIFGSKFDYEFNLVRPSGNKPCYVTTNENGLQLTSHHASLYLVREREDSYELVRVQHRMFNSPPRLVIDKRSSLGMYLAGSLKYAKEYNLYYG